MKVAVHVGASLVALVAGLLIIVLEKGTRIHRIIGKVYAGSIYVLCGVSFFIFEVTGTFSFFHVVSVQNILLVSAGLGAIAFRSRVPDWPIWHLRFMLYSYLALVGTGTLQFVEFLPFRAVALNVVVFIVVPLVVGFFWIERSIPRWSEAFVSAAPAGREAL